jgi:hypothetical protein
VTATIESTLAIAALVFLCGVMGVIASAVVELLNACAVWVKAKAARELRPNVSGPYIRRVPESEDHP